MPRRDVQRKHGTTRGSPRRSRTAKASRISRRDGEIVMCPRVGRMGPLSGEGLGQNNPDQSEGPWGGGYPSKAAYHRVVGPTLSGTTDSDHEVREGRKQTRRQPAYAGSRLKRLMFWEGAVWKCQPSSRTGENPPYGMIGGNEETSASFEVRSAPRSYPTDPPCLPQAGLTPSHASATARRRAKR